MVKGITPVISIILLLLVTISIVGFAFMFFQRTAETASQSGEEQLQQQLTEASSQPRIESAAGNKVYVRNIGSSNLENLRFFADGELKDISAGPISLPPGQVGEYQLSGFSAEAATVIKVTSGGFSDTITNPNPQPPVSTTSTIASTTTTSTAPSTSTSTSTIPSEEAYFEFTDSRDTFIFKLTDPVRIQEARDILAGRITDRTHVMGIIIKQAAPYNVPWSYQLDPSTVQFFQSAIEVCDAGIRYVEDHLAEACGGFLPDCRWCPWVSVLTREVSPP